MRGRYRAWLVAACAVALAASHASVASAVGVDNPSGQPLASAVSTQSGPSAIGATGDAGGLIEVSETGTTGSHCILWLDAVEFGMPPSSADPPERRCFSTFRESVAYASRGKVQLQHGATPESAAEQLRASGMPMLAIEYSASEYGGDSIVIQGDSGQGCYGGKQYYISNMKRLGFNNRVSSARMYSNCLGRHFQHPKYGGRSFLCESSCPGFGWMDNRTTSINFF